MRVSGWTAQRGRGLQAPHVYLRPGSSVGECVDAVGYFVGDDAFAIWYLETNAPPPPVELSHAQTPTPV